MVGIRIRVFSNDQMVARLSTETNQKSAEIIGNKPFFRKLRPPTEFVFRPYLSNGGEGGIRTHGTVARTPHFECGAFDLSATSPQK